MQKTNQKFLSKQSHDKPISIHIVRPTEIAESDVFVCESTYDELKKQIRRNHPGTALRKFKHSQLVTQDEIYHFKRPIAPAKVTKSLTCNS